MTLENVAAAAPPLCRVAHSGLCALCYCRAALRTILKLGAAVAQRRAREMGAGVVGFHSREWGTCPRRAGTVSTIL